MITHDFFRGTPRPVLRFDKMVSSFKRQILKAKLQSARADFRSSNAISFLRHVLQNIQTVEVLQLDIHEVYLKIVLPRVDSISRIFDTAQSGSLVKTNTFISGNTKEMLVPSSGLIGREVQIRDSWDVWKDVAPIKIVSLDSDELCTEWYHQIKFKNDAPTYSVFAIDTAALLMKYYVFLRKNGLQLDNDRIIEFINTHVIHFFYDDLLDIWITKFIMGVFSNNPIDKSLSHDVFSDSEFLAATKELQDLQSKFIYGSLRFGDVLSSGFYDGRSIKDVIDTYSVSYKFDATRKYRGYQLLSVIDFIDLFGILISDPRHVNLETTATRYMQKLYREINRENWASHIRDGSVIARIDTTMKRFEHLT
jgi:hypothetical protein